MYAGASGDFNPMHTDEVRRRRPGCRACSATACSPRGSSARRSPTTSVSATCGNYKIRFTKQTWPGETLTTNVTVAKKYDEGTRAPSRSRVRGHRTRTARPSSPASRRRAPGPRLIAAERLVPACGSTCPRPTSRPSRSGTPPSESRLLIKHCNACGEYHFYPRPFCPTCWSDDVEWVEASGRRDALHVVGRAPQRPAAVPRAGARTSPRSSTSPRVRA